MFVKLTVFACFVAAGLAHQWQGPLAGGEPAAKYPAGVSPQACPNFPNCANPAVAANPSAPYAGGYAHGAAPQWNAAPAHNQWNGAQANQWNGAHANQWNAAPAHGQWNGAQQQSWDQHQNPLDRGEYTGDGDYKGEGLAESGAFGPHPSWNQHQGAPVQAQAWNAAPQYAAGHHQPAPAQLPAGVSAHACPNYPYCH